MNIKELIAKLLKKGFATKAEKAQVRIAYKELGEDEKPEVAEDVEKVDKLPEDEKSEEDKINEVKEDIEKVVDEKVDEKTDEIEKRLKKNFDTLLSEKLKEQEEMLTKKVGKYSNETEEKVAVRKSLNDKVRNFIKALQVNDLATLKDMSTTNADGGYTIDRDFYAEIQHLMTEYGVFKREAYFLTTSKGSIVMNTLLTDVSVNWTDEAGVKLSTGVTVNDETLTLKKLTAIVPITDELLEDTEIDLVGFLSERIAEKISQAEDLAFFIGDGTATYGGFTGILNNANVNEVVMDTDIAFSAITVEDLMDMQDATPQGALRNGKYYMHRTILTYVRKLREEAGKGQFIYQAPSLNAPATVCGYPVVLVEAMPSKTTAVQIDKPFVLFGDLRKACWVATKPNGITMKMFDAGSVRNTANNADLNLITQDMQALRVVERIGYVAVIPTAVTVLTTDSSSS